MATVTCGACGRQNPETESLCGGCFAPLAAGPVAVPVPPAPSPQRGASSGQRICGCGEPNDPGSDRCAVCGRPFVSSLGLLFPWGFVPAPAGEWLLVGRTRGPLAPSLAEYKNVSSVHAELMHAGDVILVRDLDSMNGTFVDGIDIPPRVVVEAGVGSVIGFARNLKAEVARESAS